MPSLNHPMIIQVQSQDPARTHSHRERRRSTRSRQGHHSTCSFEFLEQRVSPAAMLPGYHVPVEVAMDETEDMIIEEEPLEVDDNGTFIPIPIDPVPDDSVVLS